MDLFISGADFQEWFCRYGQELADDKFPREEEKILKFYHDPSSTATTNHVRIDVATAFVSEMSHVSPTPSRFVHAYRITLSMAENAPRIAACQLETRHWLIMDELGHQDNVDGPGVIGEYPIVSPGSNWSYISCTHFTTKTGVMGGSFTMRNLLSGEKFEAVVPEFHMSTAAHVTLQRETVKPSRAEKK